MLPYSPHRSSAFSLPNASTHIYSQHPSCICRLRSDPALSPDSRHAAELAQIMGDDDQPLAAGMTANLHVVRAAGCSRTFQLRPNLPVLRSRFGLESQHFEARCEMLNGDQIVGTARRFLGAVVQLAERDAGDTELLGEGVEFLQQVRRIVLHHIDADIVSSM